MHLFVTYFSSLCVYVLITDSSSLFLCHCTVYILSVLRSDYDLIMGIVLVFTVTNQCSFFSQLSAYFYPP